MFKKPNRRSEVIIITENNHVYYMPTVLTVKETEEIIYALYGEHVNWDKTAIENLGTEELAHALTQRVYQNRVYQNPELLIELFNINNLRAYAEELYREALWYDIQDAKEG